MKSATVVLLILMNLMFTIPYFGHATNGIKPEETTLLPNSYGRDGGTSIAGGMTLGRKLIAETSLNSASVSTDSSRVVSVNEYNNFISHIRRP
ncbi:hypothetical protein PAHAL_7G037600 [Panicum hallii]|jgi:hypothetical protein|uniref:Uncharacterized protein n=1 Tax=Panicum hallii TaxID=206008 RepID=A0A2S3I665_9POAL|nr:hypothetical protein PAHAL_7G037600 [Panicum hallii]